MFRMFNRTKLGLSKSLFRNIAASTDRALHRATGHTRGSSTWLIAITGYQRILANAERDGGYSPIEFAREIIHGGGDPVSVCAALTWLYNSRTKGSASPVRALDAAIIESVIARVGDWVPVFDRIAQHIDGPMSRQGEDEFWLQRWADDWVSMRKRR